jgi:iron complex outermembrane recepter protein
MQSVKLALLVILFTSNAFAQSIPVEIRLSDASRSPVIACYLRVMSVADTSAVQYAISDTLGVATLGLKPGTSYILVATSLGYRSLRQSFTVTDQERLFAFTLAEEAQFLQEVQITANRPLLRQEDDKVIVDPEQLVSTSTSTMEVLEKTPGLFVDPDGNVYLSSTTPATIYINGREQRMSSADIASMLKSLPPNSISHIEILRTPSAKYDASGSGGVVNIVLKKGVKIGLTGSVNLALTQGRYGNQMLGVNLNNHQGKKHSYLNLNYSHRNSYEKVESERLIAGGKRVVQNAFTTQPSQVAYAGFGFGYEFTPKWEVNYDSRINYNGSASSSINESVISGKTAAEVLSTNSNYLQNRSNAVSVSQGVTTKYKISESGSELTTDFSFGYLENKGGQNYLTSFQLPQLPELEGNGQWTNRRYFWSGQLDARFKLPRQITIETGLKSAFQSFNSDTEYFKQVGDQQEQDVFRTNSFAYRDNINAAYLQGSRTFGSFILKAGVRLENTNMYGQQVVPSDTSFALNRTDLFPYLYLSRKVASIAGYELRSYLVMRRSITRPTYEYLNPFARFVDQYLYETGNPALRPQFTQNYEINISVQERPIFAIGRNYTQDIFTNVLYQDPVTPALAYRSYDNLGRNAETYFRLMGAIPPGKKYFFVVGMQYNYNDYKGQYENSPLAFQRGSMSFFSFHQLKLGPLSTVSLNGFYRIKGQLQFYELSNFGNVNLNINRQLLNKKLLASLSVSDLFFTNQYRFTLNQGTVSATGARISDTRRVGLSLRYNFGVRKKEEKSGMPDFDSIEKSTR